MSLGTALAVLSFGLTLIVIILIGTNFPRVAQKVIDPTQLRDSDGADLLE